MHVTVLQSFQSLRDIFQFAQQAGGSSQRLPLPNVLISGQLGCGKSQLLSLWMQSSSLHYYYLTGKDIQTFSHATSSSRGNSSMTKSWSTSFFYQLLQELRAYSKYKPTILVIDDVDDLVASRQESSLSAEGFYLLLDIMRHNSTQLGFLFTCSLPLRDIDVAILDRYVCLSTECTCLM